METSYLLIFSLAVAFLFSFASVPFVRIFAFKIKAIDVPRDNRRMHKNPTPRIGGVAIFFGFLVSYLCFCDVIDLPHLGVLIGAGLIILLGVFDDIKPIRAIYKLIVQIAAALIPVLMGLKIEFLTNLNIFSGDMIVIADYLSIPVTVIWIVGLTNALNLIDGLDGLAASIGTISSTCLLLMSLLFGRYEMLVPLAAMTGATLGFLPHNWYPARIFMGDTGALFLGYMLSVLSIDGFFKSYELITLIIPVIVLSLPLFDTTYAICRRLKNKQPIMQADRSHLHHLLVDIGFNKRQAVLILSAITALLSLTVIVLVTQGFNRTLLLLLASTVFFYAGRFYIKNKDIEKEYMEELQGEINKPEEEQSEGDGL